MRTYLFKIILFSFGFSLISNTGMATEIACYDTKTLKFCGYPSGDQAGRCSRNCKEGYVLENGNIEFIHTNGSGDQFIVLGMASEFSKYCSVDGRDVYSKVMAQAISNAKKEADQICGDNQSAKTKTIGPAEENCEPSKIVGDQAFIKPGIFSLSIPIAFTCI